MASLYRTARSKIVDALVKELKLRINGVSPYNSNIFMPISLKKTYLHY